MTKYKGYKILDFIRSKGEKGASFTEIQHFIWKLNGKPEEQFWKKGIGGRISRGYYASALYGTSSTASLLNKWCYKNDKGNWVLKRMPEPGERIF